MCVFVGLRKCLSLYFPLLTFFDDDFLMIKTPFRTTEKIKKELA